jgi:hypothetical protein
MLRGHQDYDVPAITEILDLPMLESVHIKSPASCLAPASTNLVVGNATVCGVLVDVDYRNEMAFWIETVVQSAEHLKLIVQYQDMILLA